MKKKTIMEAQKVIMSRESLTQHPFPMQLSALAMVTPIIALNSVLTMIFASVRVSRMKTLFILHDILEVPYVD